MNKAQATVTLFWDYDTQWGGDRSRSAGGKKSWGHLEFENTERLLDIHARYDIPACFAVVGSVALPGERPYHDPDQIRRIHSAGHEVASHSHRHEWLPALRREALVETLRSSKDALEQCIGAPVVTFVPPFNQPFDYPRGWSFSLSERREAGRERTDLGRLCDVLGETGYRFCRVAYQPIHRRLYERMTGRKSDRPAKLDVIHGIICVRISTGAGFGPRALAVVNRCMQEGGIGVFYGHPHSLHEGNAQDEFWLAPFLKRVQQLRDQGRLRVALPGEFVHAKRTDASVAFCVEA